MDAEHPPILVVSDGTGASAELLVRSMLVQFGDPRVPLIKLPGTTRRQEIDTAVELAREHEALMVVYTILAPDLRSHLDRGCREARIPAVDLVGGLLEVLTEHLDAPSQFRPGLFRRLHQEYFQRVEAIDFAIAHDDGQKLETLERADMVLLGVSRTGKTPLSMYLAMQGWKAANVPLIPGIEPPRQLAACDPRRLIGLTISNDLLVQHRTHRQSGLGTLPDGYADPGRVFAETEHALGIFRQRRIPAVDVTNKPIEASAREVVERVTRRLGHENLPGQGL